MRDHSKYKWHVRTISSALAILALLTTALLWGWNTFATEILGLPAVRFKHALALELLLVSIASAVPFAWRIFAAHPRSVSTHS